MATITGFTDVQKESQAQLEAAVTIGPVSIAIEADQRSFQGYKGGVLTAACGTKLDHGVLAVGYGTDGASLVRALCLLFTSSLTSHPSGRPSSATDLIGLPL